MRLSLTVCVASWPSSFFFRTVSYCTVQSVSYERSHDMCLSLGFQSKKSNLYRPLGGACALLLRTTISRNLLIHFARLGLLTLQPWGTVITKKHNSPSSEGKCLFVGQTTVCKSSQIWAALLPFRAPAKSEPLGTRSSFRHTVLFGHSSKNNRSILFLFSFSSYSIFSI